MVIIRYLFVLLLGFLGGAATTLWLVQSGTGDFVIRRTEVVQDLERRLREMELQRDALGRQLEDVVARAARMEGAFSQLERRFHDVARGAERGPAPDPPRAPLPRVEPERVPPGTPPVPAPGESGSASPNAPPPPVVDGAPREPS